MDKVAGISCSEPKYDNFYSPENADFYKSFQYGHLNRQKHHIRLIKILPTAPDELIACELLDQIPLVDVHPKYTALSYCAGDPKKTVPVLVNGCQFNVFANLAHALNEVRHLWYQNRPNNDEGLMLWVDQICIDQSNPQERSHQVGFMREIYASAEQTLVCLSTEPSKGEGMEWVNQCINTYYANGVVDGLDHLITKSNSFPESDRQLKFNPGFLAFVEILSSPWFTRIWVIQEYLMSACVIFLYGNKSLKSGPELKFMMDHLLFVQSFIIRKVMNNNAYDSKALMALLNGKLPSIQRKIASLWYLFFSRGPRTDTDPYYLSTSLRDILQMSMHCRSSDPRDRIYALLGLTGPECTIVPDYSPTMTLKKLLIETTRHIIEIEDSLDVFGDIAYAHSMSSDPTIPAWVIYWTVAERGLVKEMYSGLKAAKDTKADAVFYRESEQGDLELVVTGVMLDTVSRRISDVNGHGFIMHHSQKGYRVETSLEIESGDEIWILYGCRWPAILRPFGHKYRFVQTAFVPMEPHQNLIPNVMKGGVLDAVEKGELIARKIHMI
ncbi:HET-domain-containing protein [Tothia fuscella]|uniref:HET-domain-containing protein n=1 Tax=Tothia fuscella TaxID=1048955 RepID=A0A9P4NGM4_9PEZI|nr:HET-domain-containing protein [Tothia fuscella]